MVTASLHEERVSHRPFGAPDRHSAFTPSRVAIETDDGTLLEALDQPASLVRRAHRPDPVEHPAGCILRRRSDVDLPDKPTAS
jgi:hypothetical protein